MPPSRAPAARNAKQGTQGNTGKHQDSPRHAAVRWHPSSGWWPDAGALRLGRRCDVKTKCHLRPPRPTSWCPLQGVRSSSEIIQLQRFRQASYLIRPNPRRGAIFSRRAMQCHRPALGGPTQCISQRPHISRRWRPRNPNGHAVCVAHEFVIGNRFLSHTNMVRDAPFRGVNGDAQRRAA